MYTIGLDIGTTTLSAVAVDARTGEVAATLNRPNRAAVDTGETYARAQDANAIVEQLLAMADELRQRCGNVAALGLTGQMHGVLYVDAQGRAVSPLYTWQDGRGEQPFEGGTYASALSDATGYAMATGFGLTTHFWHAQNGRVPETAAALCTIFDYAGMRLTGRKAPLMHVSGAASLGAFDQDACAWDLVALRRAGLDGALLPEVTPRCALLGEDKYGAPVSCGIGDNQASFIGSVREMQGSVLVNMGTGGQVSMACDRCAPCEDIERRPLGDGHSILVGSSLCGGRAYALLEEFARSFAALAGYDGGSLYEAMNRAGLEALDNTGLPAVDTRFCGTRRQSDLRASVRGLSPENFNAPALIAGTLMGMAGELHELYAMMRASGAAPARELIGSGNGICKNPALRLAFERVFGMPVQIPVHREEAAYGAALFAMAASGLCTLAQAQALIRYR